jgi:hypothetical protein
MERIEVITSVQRRRRYPERAIVKSGVQST